MEMHYRCYNEHLVAAGHFHWADTRGARRELCQSGHVTRREWAFELGAIRDGSASWRSADVPRGDKRAYQPTGGPPGAGIDCAGRAACALCLRARKPGKPHGKHYCGAAIRKLRD